MFRLIRLVLVALLVPASAVLSQEPFGSDEWLKHPVDDKTFETFRPFFTYDSRLPFAARMLDTTVTDGVVSEHLSFQSTVGTRVFARLFELTDLRGKRAPGIVLVHGNSASGKDSPGPSSLAVYLAKAGYRVLSIDMPYYGERATGLMTTFTSAEVATRLYNQKATYLAFVQQVVKDIGRAYDLLSTERGADPQRIALLGISRGAIASIFAGAIDHRFGGVVLVIPGHMLKEETGHLAAACDANYIGHIAPRPLLVMSGKADLLFPPDQVSMLQRLARDPKEIIWEESGHQTPLEKDRMPMIKWLQQVIH